MRADQRPRCRLYAPVGKGKMGKEATKAGDSDVNKIRMLHVVRNCADSRGLCACYLYCLHDSLFPAWVDASYGTVSGTARVQYAEAAFSGFEVIAGTHHTGTQADQ